MFTHTSVLTQAEVQSVIINDALVVVPNATVMDAISQMSGVRTSCLATTIADSPLDVYIEARSSCVLVVEDNHVLGIFTERDVVRLMAQKLPLQDLKISEVMTYPVITLRSSAFTDIFFALNLLQQYRIRHLPIVDEDDLLVGLVTHESLRQNLGPADVLRLRLVAEVMSSLVICANPETSMIAIAHLMAKHRVGSVVIIQNQKQMETQLEPLPIPVGIITERDLVQFQALNLDLETCPVDAVMSTPIFTVKAEDSLLMAQQIIEQRRIRRVVVTGSQGQLLGIVTQSSLLQTLNPLELYKFTDILEKKILQLEAEKIELLQNRTIQLEQQVNDRKQAEARLTETNQQLAISNEQLASATRHKDEFLANMSHELRTPLNAILGMTEGLQEEVFGNTNEQQKKALQTIEHSATHLLKLINDILDLAKIEAGQVELEYAPTSISTLCQASILFIKQQAYKKRLKLNLELAPNLPDLLIDERRIRQVLINLLNNAVKFTPEGGSVTLEVTLELSTSTTTPNNAMRFAVIDTGIGIASEELKKLFQPFVQIDSALNRQYQGTGLGLSLVKRIVELHGGSIGVSSQVGMGSRFMVYLPCPDVPLSFPEPLPRLVPQLTSTTSEAVTTSPLILITEDNEANIITIFSYLKAKGYRLILANNGQEAIALAHSQQPDLILMDIQMPGMDGLEAMKHIRSHPNLVNIPIVALTALAMPGDREKCLEAGANDYLTKPVKLKQLAATIQHFLS
ncbi:sensor histidine kinase [Dulcicalothrix desertica PCC 7102]|uniref:Circadian input-output histidine kinase CikA n=1 Tax=Dulcicalothrix desertica PCC 7102 TaxID=232991 RepID=A0A433V6U3_9CYAN|nr:CBS domain-containing protein [Dulcicalothrix desertica]RUT01769.1 sensor histidine kinase [Dulcicalothrix desertica PCC 7102]TWH42921.1 signal transduction histidine kinase [Dulcicalothrix desertica PCC 7102]